MTEDEPPRDLPPDDWAVIRSVGACLSWGGRRWWWDGHRWVRVDPSARDLTGKDAD